MTDKETEIQLMVFEMCYVFSIRHRCLENCKYYNKLEGCKNKRLYNTAKTLYDKGYRSKYNG